MDENRLRIIRVNNAFVNAMLHEKSDHLLMLCYYDELLFYLNNDLPTSAYEG